MAVNAVQFGSVYNVRAIQRAQSKPAQYHAYTADAVKDREFHPEVKNDILANKLDFLA